MVFESIVIKLNRKGAGVGPDYSLKIIGRGTVIYEGFENVKVKGERKEKIDKEKIVTLLSEFKKTDFFSLNDVYPIENSEGRSSCVIGISITDKNGGIKNKNITHYHGDKNVPRKLLDLEEKIDKATGSKKWVGELSETQPVKKQSSTKKIATIVDKHEKSSKGRKKTKNRKKPKSRKKFVGLVVIFAIILLMFFIYQSGILNVLFADKDQSNNTNIPLVKISANRLEGYAPLIVIFNGSENNFIGDIVYKWDFDDGNISYDHNPVHVFVKPGIYNVSYSVTDKNDIEKVNTVQINVKSKGLLQTFVTYIKTDSITNSGFVPFNLSFSSFISDGISPFDYYWVFEDGSVSMSSVANHTFNFVGQYYVTLYMTDSNGDSSSDRITIYCN